jgi:hypothetical protein
MSVRISIYDAFDISTYMARQAKCASRLQFRMGPSLAVIYWSLFSCICFTVQHCHTSNRKSYVALPANSDMLLIFSYGALYFYTLLLERENEIKNGCRQ